MYVSDYGFAVSDTRWTSGLGDYSNSPITNNNWMYMGLPEWTISRNSGNSNYAFRIHNYGNVGDGIVNGYFAIRPCFYLNSNVTYVSGFGTQSNPYRIGILKCNFLNILCI